MRIDLELLDKEEEIEIIKKLISFKKLWREVLNRKPYLIVYLHELASLFHKYYTEHRIVSSEKSLSEARLYLVYSVKIVLENALFLLGIQAPDRM